MKQKRATKDFFSQLPLEAADDPKLFPLKSNCKTIKDSELKGIPWFNFIMFLSFLFFFFIIFFICCFWVFETVLIPRIAMPQNIPSQILKTIRLTRPNPKREITLLTAISAVCYNINLQSPTKTLTLTETPFISFESPNFVKFL